MSEAPLTVEWAITSSLPGPGRPHWKGCVFTLARMLKALEVFHGWAATDEALTAAVHQWHELAIQRVKPAWAFDWTEAVFFRGWPKVIVPYGSKPVEEAFRLARLGPPPAEASEYESAEARLLLGACVVLQQMAGDGPFILTCQQAADQLGFKGKWKAGDLFYLLVHRGHLKVAERGKGRRPARYRCLVSAPQWEDPQSTPREPPGNPQLTP